MEFQFKKDILGQPIAEFTMGHEAIGRWFSDELGANLETTKNLLAVIENIETSIIGFREIKGAELLLTLSISGIEVTAINSDYELEEDFYEDAELYESEFFSECGLLDFKQAVLSWLEFIS
jgi:uncharacterized protein YacL (UPF0231 family)